MKLRIFAFAMMALMGAFLSCQEDDDSELIALEDRVFNAYLENNDIAVEPTESGLYYVPLEEGDGLSPLKDNWVLINYDLYLLDGEQLVFTTDKEKAIEYNIHDQRVVYGPSKIQIGNNLQGLDEGLKLMNEGGEAQLLFKSDLGYGRQGAGVIGSYKSLIVEIELLKVIENPIEYENERAQNYLTENSFSEFDSTASGLVYIEMVEGTGDSAQTNSNVTINVKGYLVDGRKFLDEDVFRFQLGQYDYAVTEGLSEGVSYMKEGGKSKLVVPYYLGYGEGGKSYFEGKAKVPIPPYSTLIYDVELLNAR
jgi:FKBP-type peptidyl-prolyl cis-trans isomerase